MLLLQIVDHLSFVLVLLAVSASGVKEYFGGECVLPPFPDNGMYTTDGNNASPGQIFDNVSVNVICNSGYSVENNISSLSCFDGVWSDVMPNCVRMCNLYKHPSVEYRCLKDHKYVECGWQIPSGTVVEPVCRPHYRQPSILFQMRCFDGNMDYILTCKPECGVIHTIETEIDEEETDVQDQLTNILPWHALVYTKDSIPYKQICSGSLISTTAIISVANCFWDDFTNKLLPATNYAAAMGKRYQSWDDLRDRNAQKSDVSDVNVPSNFVGSLSNYKDDIAVIIVETPFTYDWHIGPVCIGFDINLEMPQLEDDVTGKIAVWDPNGSQELKTIGSSYVRKEECVALSAQHDRKLITSDKICAESSFDMGVDRGSGLVFPAFGPELDRYYLRGIVSASPRSYDTWNPTRLYYLTRLSKHEHFIKSFI